MTRADASASAEVSSVGVAVMVERGVSRVEQRPAPELGAREVLVEVAAVGVIQGRELTLTGTFRYANTYPTAIELAASGRVELTRLITSRHTLDDVHGALTRSHENPAAIKPVVTPNRRHHERRTA